LIEATTIPAWKQLSANRTTSIAEDMAFEQKAESLDTIEVKNNAFLREKSELL
jgi:hypothetical protein